MSGTTPLAVERTWARPPAEQEASASREMPQILYIMGTGRSGTTILEILLASSPELSGVGEVKYIFRDAFIRDEECGCGAPGRNCTLWGEVARSAGWQPAEWSALGAITDSLESHARFPLAWLGIANRMRLDQYKRANEALFAEVARLRACRSIVDSSKHAGRALLLARLFPEKVRVLCMTRSAEGIIAAFQKKNQGEQRPKRPLAVAAYYLYVLGCMRLVRARLKDRCFVIRFEDLTRDPVGVLEAIECWSGLSFALARQKVTRGEPFEVGHIVTGNRIRKKGTVRFEPGSGRAETRQSLALRWLANALERYRRLLGF